MQKPYLKWPGSKTKLVEEILKDVVPEQVTRFIEPFGGTGVVALNFALLYPEKEVVWNDFNEDLLLSHARAISKPKGFIKDLENLFVDSNRNQETYNALRKEFNDLALKPSSTAQQKNRKAALFVYLNRHCFNGICRYSQKGLFNTPFGKYKTVYLPENEIMAFSKALKKATLKSGGFLPLLDMSGPGDFVYCDPPYAPLSETANFTAYSSGAFGEKEQRALAEAARNAAKRGAVVSISNHDTPFTREIYQGAKIRSLLVNRSVSASGASRGKAKELIAVFMPE